MSDMRELKILADIWITRYGADAAAQIRRWAADPAQSVEAADYLEQIAQAAERLLAGKK